MKYTIAVIGGGAAGLMAALTAAGQGAVVTIWEGKDRLGKKILSTGNGKCNFTNLVQKDSCYRGSNPEFSKAAREFFSIDATLAYFEKIGILPKVKNGYVYPNSEQAASVADALSMEVRAANISVMKEEVVSVRPKNGHFLVKGSTASFEYDRVILCMGSCAGMKDGTKFRGYEIVKELGHKVTEVFPALVQMKCREKWFKTVAGVRTEAKLTLFENGREIATEQGEVLFAEYGLSGIPVFQISRYAGAALLRGSKVTCKVDFFPSTAVEELKTHLSMRVENGKTRTAEEILIGLQNHKLNYIILKECNINPVGDSVKEFKSGAVLDKLAKKYKNLECEVTELNSFANAQICAGGADTDELCDKTMESRLHKGLYMAGELVDIDGTCGGYNLQWAWSSGYTAGYHAATDR